MLKSIEIFGFKSFGKRAVLDFTKSISSIVGPNGSGKSNVAESFRFVLGEQSVKSMRGKKVEDLIFNGGKDSPRANRASVKLTFDNRKRLLNLDFDEVSLERVIHRDAVSEYFINGSPARLKDITELLASAHIGSSGHHIISQGEADRILNANPKERREMVEDALGLKIYQFKKQESERKLEKTAENIEKVESLRREIAPHLKFLKKQVEKIEKTIELRNELTKLYLEYFKRESEYLKHAKIQIEEDKKGPNEKMTRLEEELRQAKAVLAESQTKDAKSDKLVGVETELRRLRQAKDTVARELGRLEGEVSSLVRFITKQKEQATRNAEQKIYLSEVESVAKEMFTVADEALQKGDQDTLLSALKNMREKLSYFLSTKRNEEAKLDFADTEKEIEILKNKIVAEEENLKKYLAEEKDWQKQYEDLRLEIEREKDSNRDAEKAVFRIMAEQNELHGILSDLKNREEKIKADELAYNNELREAGVLVGVGVLRFEANNITAQDGHTITIEEIVNESRHEQDERRKGLERLKIRLEDAGIGSSDEVLKEFKDVTDRDAFLAKELEDLLKSSEALKILIKDLDEKLDTEFKAGVDKINKQFNHFFTIMFGGGSASLSLVREQKRRRKSDLEALGQMASGEEMSMDEMEPEFEEKEGLDIEVNLPRKKIKGLIMLSGGERALTSIALIFAMSQVNPPPFIILDETDAALDEANSRKYGDMIDNLSHYSQLILVTHNRETMSRAGVIYGVTMGGDGVSKVLSIEFDEAVQVAK